MSFKDSHGRHGAHALARACASGYSVEGASWLRQIMQIKNFNSKWCLYILQYG